MAIAIRAAEPVPAGVMTSRGDASGGFPVVGWVLLFIVGAVLRLADLTTLSAWPILDEGQHAFYGLEIARQGVWRPFYGIAQLPPFFIWVQGVVFKLFGASLETLWSPYALYSIAGLAVGLHVARGYLRGSAGILLGGFLAFGFWPNWSGRYANWFSSGFLWEWVALWFLARLMVSGPNNAWSRAWILGLFLGTGFQVMIPWPGVVAVVALAVLWKFRGKGTGRRVIGHFFAALCLGSLPFVVLAVREGYGTYIAHAFSLGGEFDAGKQWNAWIYYATLPWMRSFDPNAYGPVWYGLFNPVAGALLVLGAWVAWRRRREPFMAWLAGSSLFLMIPGFITSALDAFRVMQAWPFLTTLAALGGGGLADRAGKRRVRVIVLLVLLSGILDAYHLFGRYRATWGNLDLPIPIMKNSELAAAHRILLRETAARGPGRLLLNLRPDPYDQTLTAAADGFMDGPWAPGRNRQPSWTAFLVNIHYRPFVSARYPRIEWHDLGDRLGWPYGHLALAVVPEGAVDAPVLARWIEADSALQPLTAFLLNRRLEEGEDRVLSRLAVAYPSFKGDPFLESCFHERAYLHFVRAGDNRGAEEALRRALERGYKAAHFHYHLGHLQRASGRKEEARGSFEKALTAPDNRTDAANALGKP